MDVSVITTVHNEERYIQQAIDSVLEQSFQDFELVIVDDGSTDGTGKLIKSYTDPRIRSFRHVPRIGVTKSLNVALEKARGSFIARLDGNDVCHPHRLERQLSFLCRNPSIGLLGTNIDYIDQESNLLFDGSTRYTRAYSRNYWRWKLLWSTPLVHSSVMIRRSVLQKAGGRYDEHFPYAQDYELWARVSRLADVFILPAALLHYRVHDGISTSKKCAQGRCHYSIAKSQLERFLEHPISDESLFNLVFTIVGEDFLLDRDSYSLSERKLRRLFRCVFDAFSERFVLSEQEAGDIKADIENRLRKLRQLQLA